MLNKSSQNLINYKLISTSDTSITLPIKMWENDLNLSPNPDFWIEICKNTFSMTTNTNLQLIQYKTIHRTHITQSKMFKMGLADTDSCSQCTLDSTDNDLYATWVCQPVHSFWTAVTNTLSTIFGCRIPLSSSLCLLRANTKIPPKHKNPLLISLTIAKKIVFQNWKSRKKCHITHCIYIAPLSKALYNFRLSFSHSHTHGDWLPCKVPTSSSGAIGG